MLIKTKGTATRNELFVQSYRNHEMNELFVHSDRNHEMNRIVWAVHAHRIRRWNALIG